MTMNFSAPSIDAVVLAGGLDQITPTLVCKNGVARQSLNFECMTGGGYGRIFGYERFDGQTAPSAAVPLYLTINSWQHIPAVGETIKNLGNTANGVIAYLDQVLSLLVVTKTTGTFTAGEDLYTGTDLIGPLTSFDTAPATPYILAKAKAACANIYRALIAAVPGSGPIRGVAMFNGTLYAWRDNAATPATALACYKSSDAGWALVPYDKTVTFSSGTTAPAEGATLTQGGVTATIKRVVLTAGAWTGTAAGKLIISATTGGNFSGAAATATGGTTLTLAGIQTDIALLPGGRLDIIEYNFGGQAATDRLYIADGVNKAWEFDGTITVPIATGATTDTPTHVIAHRNFLWLSFRASAIHSAPGLPYDWNAINGAEEFATGEDITNFIVMPGGTTSATLGILSRNNTSVLYGTDSTTWNLVQYNTGCGGIAFSGMNMAQTLAFDDRGALSIQAALQYGNFDQSTITARVLPFIDQHINKFTAATLCRRKSQYRLFFDNGDGLFITIIDGKLIGCMPVYFPDVVRCTYEGKDQTGADVLFFGSDDGMVYQMEKGTSFDGEEIQFSFVLNYSNAKSPRTLKTFRKAVPELLSASNSYVTFDFAYLLGYDSPEYNQAVNSEYNQFIGTSRWDSFTWDNFFWDSQESTVMEIPLDGTAENIAASISGAADYIYPFTINSLLIHYSPRRLMR